MNIIHCKSETKILNKKTGKVYKDEAEVKKDIEDASTDTTESDIQRNVNIIVPELSLDGETD
tara:strand:- start:86 stop:271 length:186 start_codon:yes stop_codon:yes gene_type:complete